MLLQKVGNLRPALLRVGPYDVEDYRSASSVHERATNARQTGRIVRSELIGDALDDLLR